jgi:hypothetical protein
MWFAGLQEISNENNNRGQQQAGARGPTVDDSHPVFPPKNPAGLALRNDNRPLKAVTTNTTTGTAQVAAPKKE